MLVEILFALLLIFILFFWKAKYSKSKLQFPSPPKLPLIGHAHHFWNPKDLPPAFIKFTKLCGPNFVINLGLDPLLIINDTKLLEIILGSSKFIDKSKEYNLTKKWFGEGLLTSTGEKWKSHRKMLTPGFHYKILEEFVKIFNTADDILITKLKGELKNTSFNIFEYMTLCTLDIICETAMGTQINAQKYPNTEFVRSFKAMVDILYKRLFTILRFDLISKLTGHHAEEKRLLKILQGFSMDIIEKRREVIAKNFENNAFDGNNFGMKKKNSFLDILLLSTANGKPLTNEEIREEVDTFLFEGHDTTAIAISFTFYELSRNLHIQQKVYNEVIETLGTSKDREITYNDLQNMKYLAMVIKETLRLYPSVPGFARQLNEDVVYENKVLPKGLVVAFMPYSLHRMPELYPMPDKFDPERFTLENSSKRHPYAYIPFSAGPRNCIGQKFAMLEMKATIAKVLWHYKILPAIPEHFVEIVSKATIQSANGVKVRLETREHI